MNDRVANNHFNATKKSYELKNIFFKIDENLMLFLKKFQALKNITKCLLSWGKVNLSSSDIHIYLYI